MLVIKNVNINAHLNLQCWWSKVLILTLTSTCNAGGQKFPWWNHSVSSFYLESSTTAPILSVVETCPGWNTPDPFHSPEENTHEDPCLLESRHWHRWNPRTHLSVMVESHTLCKACVRSYLWNLAENEDFFIYLYLVIIIKTWLNKLKPSFLKYWTDSTGGYYL